MPNGLGRFKPWGSPEAGSCALELNPWGGLVCGAALSYPNLSELPVWLGAHLSGRELGGPTFPSAAQ